MDISKCAERFCARYKTTTKIKVELFLKKLKLYVKNHINSYLKYLLSFQLKIIRQILIYEWFRLFEMIFFSVIGFPGFHCYNN